MEYTLYVDSQKVTQHRLLKNLKKEADFRFEHLNAYDAQIIKGNTTYTRLYNTEWIKLTTIKEL